MPLARRHCRVGGKRRRHRGRGIMDFLNKAHSFVKNNQLVSKGASLLAPTIANKFGSNAGNIAAKIGNVAGALGYGRRRRMHRLGMGKRRVGYGLHLAGM